MPENTYHFLLQDPISICIASPWRNKGEEDGSVSTTTMSSSSFDNSSNSNASSSSISSDLIEDASSSSSTSYSCFQSSKGPLYELSDLMAHLPIKRGLSKHFQGKSQSFTSLCNVKCVEDLAKKESPYGKRMKSCKSYGGGLDGNTNKSYALKASSKTISKKGTTTKGSSFSSLLNRTSSPSSRSSFLYKNNF